MESLDRRYGLLFFILVQSEDDVAETESLKLDFLLYFLLHHSYFPEVFDEDLFDLVVLHSEHEAVEFHIGVLFQLVVFEHPLEEVSRGEVEVVLVFEQVVPVESLREKIEALDHVFGPLLLPRGVLKPNFEALEFSLNFQPSFAGEINPLVFL